MAYRCPACNKFVPIEPGTPEENEIYIDDNQLVAKVRVYNVCAECQTELSEAFISTKMLLPDTILNHTCYDEDGNPLKLTFSVDDVSLEANDYYDGTDDIPLRYRKHMYGFIGTVTCSCVNCGYSEKVYIAGYAAASSMDVLV
jgi:hypothetical protein